MLNRTKPQEELGTRCMKKHTQGAPFESPSLTETMSAPQGLFQAVKQIIPSPVKQIFFVKNVCEIGKHKDRISAGSRRIRRRLIYRISAGSSHRTSSVTLEGRYVV